jgi:hypothetical protein
VMTEVRARRPFLSDPVEGTKTVTVPPNGTAEVNLNISEKRSEMALPG